MMKNIDFINLQYMGTFIIYKATKCSLHFVKVHPSSTCDVRWGYYSSFEPKVPTPRYSIMHKFSEAILHQFSSSQSQQSVADAASSQIRRQS